LSAIGLGIVTSEAIVMDRPADANGLTVYVFAGALVPVAIGIAILRHHLYDIDRLISRTIGWALVTGLVVALFAGSVVGLQALLATFTQGQTIAVAASTLFAFALFQPVRRRIQAIVDRRFDRSRYDADQTVRAFTGRLRNDIDLASITHEVTWTADAAVRPASAAVWLRGTRR
jgi:hypothetical protein